MRSSHFLVVVAIVFAAAAVPAEGDLATRLSELASPDPGVRAAAKAALAGAGAGAVPVLRKGLASHDPVVVVACADLVRREGIRDARSELRAVVEDAGSPGLAARACCLALGRVGDYRDVGVLAKALGRFPEAALALAGIGDRDGLAPLEGAWAAGNASPEVGYALIRLGDDRGYDLLLRGLGEGGDGAWRCLYYLRRAAGKDAGIDHAAWVAWWRREKLARRLGDGDWDRSEAALAEARREKPLEDLVAIAGDRSRPLAQRTKAILAVGLIGRADTASAMLDLLREDPDGEVCVYAAEALGRIGVPETAADLARYLIFDEERFRALSAKDRTGRYYTVDSEVCKALVRMGIEGGLDYMIRQLAESHRIRIYHEAVRTLRLATGRNFDYRPDGSAGQRAAAARRWRWWFDEHRAELKLAGNADLGDPALRARIAALVKRLGHYQFLFMSRALETLVLLGRTVIPEVVAGLGSANTHIRVHCAEILGRIRARGTESALAELLRDPRGEVRVAAAGALADMGPGPARDALLAALRDPVLDVRIEAARGLARVEAEALPALADALSRPENDSEDFRVEADFALAAHGRVEAVDRLAARLDRKEVAFRRRVASRILAVTGRDPGVEKESIRRWREWWKLVRGRYTPGLGGGGER